MNSQALETHPSCVARRCRARARGAAVRREPRHPAPGDPGRVRDRHCARPQGRGARAGHPDDQAPPGRHVRRAWPARQGSRHGRSATCTPEARTSTPTTPSSSTRTRPSVVLDAFATGDVAMRTFAPRSPAGALARALRPGDHSWARSTTASPQVMSMSPSPYAYVGPWTPRAGAFWNTEFGAARPMTELGGVDALVAFFEEGARRAVADPPRAS